MYFKIVRKLFYYNFFGTKFLRDQKSPGPKRDRGLFQLQQKYSLNLQYTYLVNSMKIVLDPSLEMEQKFSNIQFVLVILSISSCISGMEISGSSQTFQKHYRSHHGCLPFFRLHIVLMVNQVVQAARIKIILYKSHSEIFL